MWSIYEFEKSENSSSVPLHFSFQAATSPFGLSLFSYSQFWDGRIELKDVNTGGKIVSMCQFKVLQVIAEFHL